MIGTLLLLAAGVIVAGLFTKFWNEILDFTKSVIMKVQEKIHKKVTGVQAYLRRKSDNQYEKRTINYVKNEKKEYQKIFAVQDVEANEIPEEYRNCRLGEEIDITGELENLIV